MTKNGSDFRKGDTFSDGRSQSAAIALSSGLHMVGDPESLAKSPLSALSEWVPASDASPVAAANFSSTRQRNNQGFRTRSRVIRNPFDDGSPASPAPPPPAPPPAIPPREPDIQMPSPGVPTESPGPYGAPGVRYSIVIRGYLSAPYNGAGLGPAGGIVEGPFSVSGLNTLTMRVVGANGTQTSALSSSFDTWKAINFESITIVP